MAWRIVKQPNGCYARFSDVVDDFTHMNMTREEALDVCLHEGGDALAENKLKNADEDQVLLGTVPKDAPKGLHRWHHSLEKIRIIHGPKTMGERVKSDQEHKP